MQSIYNRLSSGKYGSSTIKELIVAGDGKQYEPVGRAVKEFKAINSKETAIAAVMKSKSINSSKAKIFIEETEKALNDDNLKNNSAIFIGSRTDFYSVAIQNQIPKGAVGLVERDNQIFGWFFPGSIAYSKDTLVASPVPNFA
jgi:hypothetical protein